MNNETRVTTSTKVDAKAEAVKTNVILNWDDCSQEEIRALAQQALIVKLQSGWRRNGIPAEATINVKDHKAGARTPKAPTDILALIQKMNPTDRAAAIAALTAGASVTVE